MSGGRKKSGFQITSVTSDYEQQQQQQQQQQEAAAEPGGGGELGQGPRRAAGEEPVAPVEDDSRRQAKGAAAPRNGPVAPPGSSAASASRFRVVKLAQGLGEPYKRGRWTCRDFYEPQEVEHLLVGRLAEAGRLPQSLDSRLEVAGLLARPPSPFSPQPQRRRVAYLQQAQLVLPPGPAGASSGHQARSVGGGLPVLGRPHRTPTSPGALRSPLAGLEARPPGPGASGQEAGDSAPAGPGPALLVEDLCLPQLGGTQLGHRETEERRKVLPRESRSRPSSPALPLLFRDASPGRRTSDPFGAARFSLARSMFGMGVAQDGDDDSGTNSSMIAIDNKIEQAMDLVKSHLMFAVREEVEVLREQIKELSERNAVLEQENALLRSLANAEQLNRFQAQLHSAKPPPPSGTT